MKNYTWTLFLLLLLVSSNLFAQNEIGDQLIKSTVRIVNRDTNDSLFVGTGFFFSYNPDTSWHGRIEVIVTNKHVVSNSKTLYLGFRSQSFKAAKGIDSIRNYELKDPVNWIYNHPDPSVDLCIIFLKPIIDYFLKNFNEKLNITYFTKQLIPDSTAIKGFSSIEDVIMIGYPKGIIESSKLYPIVRKGITASPFNTDFNNRQEFLTDVFAIGGSSGSPVILFRKGYLPAKDNQLSQFVNQPYLLGIHYAGADDNKLNLGVNIKSNQIIEILESFIKLKSKDPKETQFLEKFKKDNSQSQ
jgi:Trypsin-like peptidase domain